MNGFILSHHWQDHAEGLQLEYWVSTDHGAKCLHFTHQPVVCFVSIAQVEELPQWPGIEVVTMGFKHFQFGEVATIYCRNYKVLLRFRTHCEQEEIVIWEDDIKPIERFTMERFIRGSVLFDAANKNKDSIYYLNPKIKPTNYQPNLKILSVDIETSMPTTSAKEALYSIGFVGQYKDENTERIFMIGDPATPHPGWMSLYTNVSDLLKAVNKWILQYDPDVIVGWNVVNFDMTVLDRIYREHQIPFAWGRLKKDIRLRKGRNNLTYIDIPGRVVVDGIDALRTATYSFESFSLENVSRQLLNDGKEIHDVNNRGGAISDLFHDDKIALAKYNRKDCQLVLDIFQHTRLLDFLIQRSFLTGLTLDRLGGSVAAFEYLYLPKIHRAGYIAPNLNEGYDGIKAPGGFVMNSKPGFYNDVIVLDFKSLYPSIILTFKIDPMGLIEGLHQNTSRTDLDDSSKSDDESNSSDTIPGFNGAEFHRENHFLPDIIQELWHARDQAKINNDSAASQAIKIIMNSFYGVLGSNGCRFFDARLASSITERGHEIIQTSAQWIEDQGFEVIYGDTDSVFVWLKNQHSSDKAQIIGESLARGLNTWWKTYLLKHYNLSCHLELEFEQHYTRFLMPTIRGSDRGSKKRYAGLDNQGNITFKGLEAVRSDWTPLARELQTELYRRIFFEEDYKSFLTQTITQLTQGQLDHKLIYRKRIRRNLVDYVKNIPPQIQAARKAENWLALNELPSRYENGGWIEYIMTHNGPEPIENIVSQLDYEHYIDKQIAPVADGILYFFNVSFETLNTPQQDLFNSE